MRGRKHEVNTTFSRQDRTQFSCGMNAPLVNILDFLLQHNRQIVTTFNQFAQVMGGYIQYPIRVSSKIAVK